MQPITQILENKLDSDYLLRELCTNHQVLYDSQINRIQRFIDAQARLIAEALVQKLDEVHFLLPDSVIVEGRTYTIEPGQREQQVNSSNHLSKTSLRNILRERLSILEHTPDPAISAASQLIRHITALYMVHQVLPSGRKNHHSTPTNDENSTIPELALQTGEPPFLPQWVSFDEQGNLLTNSVEEAEANLASMQHFIQVLHDALALTPYIVVDPVYQQKRQGMLGQLTDQGRALTLYQTRQIIVEIKHRIAARELNSGLCFCLPYFDDQALQIQMREIEIIPAGRNRSISTTIRKVMQAEGAMVAQDTRISSSTRKHLLIEMDLLGRAFEINPLASRS